MIKPSASPDWPTHDGTPIEIIFLQAALSNLYLKKFRKISAENNNRRLSAHRDHTKIVELIKAGNKEEAIAVNRKHLLEAKEFLIKQVES